MKRTKLLVAALAVALLACCVTATTAFAASVECTSAKDTSLRIGAAPNDACFDKVKLVISYRKAGAKKYKQVRTFTNSSDIEDEKYVTVKGLKKNAKYYVKAQYLCYDYDEELGRYEKAHTETATESFYTVAKKPYWVSNGGTWKRVKIKGKWYRARVKTFKRRGATAFIERQKTKTVFNIKGYGRQSETKTGYSVGNASKAVTAIKFSGTMYGFKYTVNAYQVGKAKVTPVLKRGGKYYAYGYPAFNSYKALKNYVED